MKSHPVGRANENSIVVWFALTLILAFANTSPAQDATNPKPVPTGAKNATAKTLPIDQRPADLVVPPATRGEPQPGKRVRQQLAKYADTKVHHLLYLPADWKPDGSYPVIVEYAGNKWRTSAGTVEGSSLGFGISAGKGVIWICMPYVNTETMANQPNWWGNVNATVEYCLAAVNDACENHGGDKSRVFIAGFSRGAIACNYIGLHDDRIAKLWKGFIAHSHYDGVRKWGYPESDRDSAVTRLRRLDGRPQWISMERSIEANSKFLSETLPNATPGQLTLVPIKGIGHNDTWVLRPSAERDQLRAWFRRHAESVAR